MNTYASPHGYAPTILRSRYTKRKVKKTVYLCCDRGRKPKAYADHVDEAPHANFNRAWPRKCRNTTTLALACLFEVVLRKDLQTGLWRLTIEDSKPQHNHQPSPASTHYAQRNIERECKEDETENELRQGRTTRQILTELREADSESIPTSRAIYNWRRKVGEMFLAGRTPLQALLIELPKDGSWIFKYKLDDNGTDEVEVREALSNKKCTAFRICE